MKVTSVSSAQNPTIKGVRALHQRSAREKEGLFLIEGPKLLNEAFAKGIEVTDVVVSKSYWTEGMLHLEQAGLVELQVVDDKLFKEITTTQSPCGVLAIGVSRRRDLHDCFRGDNTLIVVGESIQDPGNAGTLVRAALAFGATGLVLTKGSVDMYNPKVVRSAMGALFALPVVANLELEAVVSRLKSQNVRILALEPSAQHELRSARLTGPLAIVLGNEGNGLSAGALKSAGELISIRTTDATESLNVAVCAAIVLHECAAQRTPRQPN